MAIQVTLNANEFQRSGKYEGRQYTSLRVKDISKGRVYFTIIKDQIKYATIAKQMKLENGNVIISFGKNDKLIIGTYIDTEQTPVNEVTEQVEEETKEENIMEKTITNNEILFTCKADIEKEVVLLSLHKQSYSDGTCFYSLQDNRGNWKVDHGNKDLNKLIEQMEHELRIHQEYKDTKYIIDNEEVRKVYEAIEEWKMNIINQMKAIINLGNKKHINNTLKVSKEKEIINIHGYMGKVEEREGKRISHNELDLYLVKSSKHWTVYEQKTGKRVIGLKNTKKEAMKKLEETLNNYYDKLKEVIENTIKKDGYISDYKIGSWIRSA